MKILILTIATNKYIQFVERLYDNIEDKFLNGHEIQGLLFTEHDVETSDNIKYLRLSMNLGQCQHLKDTITL